MSDITRAVATLRAGGLVAFPTETVYGLGADAANPEALARLYAVKRRPVDHPVIVHLGRAADLDAWAETVPTAARVLADACWPGALTLVLERTERVPDAATGGLDTVGLRVPDHPLALDLLRAFGGGLAAPSANRFGRVSPTTAAAVRNELGTDVEQVLDGGPCAIGVESTIVDCTQEEPRILREGGIPREQVEALLGREVGVGGTTRAPGTLAAHYSPRARVVLVAREDVRVSAEQALGAGQDVGVLGLRSDTADSPDSCVTLATPATTADYARALYAALRRADEVGLDVVFAVPPPVSGLGAAVVDRLKRAAASH